MHNLAESILENVNKENKKYIKIVDSQGKIGSGAYPTLPLNSKALRLDFPNKNSDKIAIHMRTREIPIFGYISNDYFYLNMLTVNTEDIKDITNALNTIA